MQIQFRPVRVHSSTIRLYLRPTLCMLAAAVLFFAAVPVSAQPSDALPSGRASDGLIRVYESGDHDAFLSAHRTASDAGDTQALHHLLAGRVLMRRGRCSEAAQEFEAVGGMDGPNWVVDWSVVHRAECAWRNGAIDEVDALLADGADGVTDNIRLRARSLQHLLGRKGVQARWPVYRREALRLHVSPALGWSPEQSRRESTRRAGHYTRIARAFGLSTPPVVDVFLWSDRAQAAENGIRPVGRAFPGLSVVHMHVRQTPAHELVHVIANRPGAVDSATRFISEGTAVYLDGTGRDRMATARRMLWNARASLPPTLAYDASNGTRLMLLWDAPGQASQRVAYAVAAAVVEALVDRSGWDAFLQFYPIQQLDHARKTYGPDVDDFFRGLERRLWSRPDTAR